MFKMTLTYLKLQEKINQQEIYYSYNNCKQELHNSHLFLKTFNLMNSIQSKIRYIAKVYKFLKINNFNIEVTLPNEFDIE